jgi:hypothetical protein
MDDTTHTEPHLAVRLLAAMVCLLCLSGCGPMEITEQVPAPPTETPATGASLPAEHDLALLAIDFSPPLDQSDLWSELGQVTLLIAVENRGLSQERGIQVSATLSDPGRPETLLKKSTSLTALAPGEVQVVRFSGISAVPYRKAYELEVRVTPVEGEWALANNAKIYGLTIKEPASAQASDFTSPLRAP